jgi:cytochrome c-type biogenesis protein CcmF
MMLLTLLGTIFPLISSAVAGQAITVNPSFYNKAVLPLAVLLVMIMGVAPLLTYGRADLAALARRLRTPLVISVVAMIGILAMTGFSFWTASCTLAISLTVCGIADDYANVVATRRRATSGGWFSCAFGALDANHRRYGGHLAHLGVAMIVAGVAGSSLYATKSEQQLRLGQSTTVGHYTLALDEIRTLKGENYEAAEAVLKVADGRGGTSIVRPQTRQYQKAEQRSAEIAFQTGLREDLYVSLLGTDGENAALQIIVNPLVIWIWIGGIALAVGGVWGMLPQFARSQRPATNEILEAEPVTAS